MKTSVIYILTIFLFLVNNLQAQISTKPLLEDKENFILEADSLFKKALSPTSDSVWTDFQEVWNLNLNVEQKKLVISIATSMHHKKFPLEPHFENFYACVAYGVKAKQIQDEVLTRFLGISDTTVNFYKPKIATKFFKSTRLFFEKNYLHESKFNSLEIKGGTFKFEHVVDESLFADQSITSSTVPGFEEDTAKGDWYKDVKEEKSDSKEEDNGWGDDWDGEDEGSEDDDDWGDEEDSDDGGWGEEGWDDGEEKDEGWGDDDRKVAQDEADAFGGQEIIDDSDQLGSESDVYTPYEAPIPLLNGPFLVLEDVSFSLNSIYDTVTLYNTSAALLIKSDTIVGNGGTVNWAGLGLDSTNIYCEFHDYTFSAKLPHLVATYAEFNYKEKLDTTKVLGVYEYKGSITNNDIKKARYPRFKSYLNNVFIRPFVEDETGELIYIGGFSIKGTEIGSDSYSNYPSTIALEKDGQLRFSATSNSGFSFKDSVLYTKLAKLVIYQNHSDSLVHPGVTFKYHVDKSILKARKEKHSYKKTPFYNSFHRIDIHADYLEWDINTDSINFNILSAKDRIPLIVTSDDYYNSLRYSKLSNAYSFHPLQMVMYFAMHKKKRKTFTMEQMGVSAMGYNKYLKKENVIKGAMVELSNQGFIDFNPEYELITITRKGWLNYLAHNKKIDYDNMIFTSRFSKPKFKWPTPDTVSQSANDSLGVMSEDGAIINDSTAVNTTIIDSGLADSDTLATDSNNTFVSGNTLNNDGVIDSLGTSQADSLASVSDNNNATLDLSKNEFIINGVRNFSISDSLHVTAIPKNKKVKLKHNRITEFSGTLSAGGLTFYGSDFIFDYDSFEVIMPKIDSLVFSVSDTTTEGGDKKLPNNVVNTSGVLYISKPNNKSGLKDYPQFPDFQSSGEGTITFNKSDINGGGYKDDRISFHIPEMNLKGIGKKSNLDAVNFKGTFKSGGIFKEFDEELSVNEEDGSFGFDRDTPEDGEPIYGGKGRFYSNYSMSSKGLRGNGKISYLTGTYFSDDFIFYPDSVITRGQSLAINPEVLNGTGFPSVHAEDYNMRWLTTKNEMSLTDNKKPFQIYDTKTTFSGELKVSPKVVSGSGELLTRDSYTKSDHFAFGQFQYNCQDAYFEITSNDPNKPIMKGKHVTIDYDLIERHAIINSERANEKSFSFPYTQFETNLGHTYWNIDEKKLIMTVTDQHLDGKLKFYSTRVDQDTIEIDATDAVYDLSDFSLKLDGVGGFRIGNLKVFPKDSKVVIRENANIDSLYGAKLILNAFTRYHTITDATIKIVSREKLTGNGVYSYINNVDDTFKLNFENFKMGNITKRQGKEEIKTFVTTAESSVTEQDEFVPFAGFKYQGNLKMIDSKKYLRFKGLMKLDVKRQENDWFTYDSKEQEDNSFTINDDVRIARYKKKPLTGLYLSKINKQLYSSLLEFRPEREKDEVIFLGEGLLTFDPTENEYLVAPKSKRDSLTFKGDEFVYNDAEQKSKFHGKFSFVNDTQIYQLNSSGSGKGDLLSGDFDFNVLMSIEFDAGRQMFDDMPSSFEYETTESPLEDDDYADAKDHIIDLLTDREEKTFFETEFENTINIANYLYDGIVLSNVELKWSKERNAFYSVGDLGISNMYRTRLNANVKGYLEIPKDENSSTLNLFLITQSDIWYYFSFQKNKIFIWSNNEYFNDNTIYKKQQKIFRIASKAEIQGYVNGFRENYMGISDYMELEFLEVEDAGSAVADDEDDLEEDDDETDDEETDDEEDDDEEDDDDGF